ncbi:ALIX V-shaped domain binding to protein HIV, partial [Toxoplasma gondii MAS]
LFATHVAFVASPLFSSTLLSRVSFRLFLSLPGLLLQSPLSASTGGDAADSRPQTEASVLATWLKSQELSYLAAAHFQLARYEQEQVEMEGEGYGRLVARLRVCREFLAQAAALVEAHSLKCNLSGLFAHIVQTHEQLERDNAVVYLEAVPDPSRLTPLEHASCVELASVAIQDLQEVDAHAAAQLCQLLPTSVRLRGEEYATRYRAGVRDLKQRVSEELSGVSSFLLARQLPDQLREVALKLQEEKKVRNQPRADLTLELPPHLWNQIRAVQAAGGFDAYEEQQALLAQASVGTQRQLADIERLLEAEEAADEAFREESGGPPSDKKERLRTPDARGNCNESDLDSGDRLSDEESLMLLVPASELASQFRVSLDKYRSKAEQAQSANLSLEAKLREAVLPVPLCSSLRSPPSRVSSPSAVGSPPSSAQAPRNSGGSALCMRATLKAASPSEVLACLLPRLEACMQSRQTETERTQRAAERDARIREREEKLHLTHQALANLEAAVHALQSEANRIQEDVDLDAVHSLLLRARNEGELFDSVLLREEQATLGVAQERIATACRSVRTYLEEATTSWETLSVSEGAWCLFTREEKARASEALRMEANAVFSSLSVRLNVLMEMQDEQEEGAAFFCQLQQFLSEIRRQVEMCRESREAARQRGRERRRFRETAETSRRSEENWEEPSAKATAESCPPTGEKRRRRQDGDEETHSTEAIRHNSRREETDAYGGDEGDGGGERRGLSAASSPRFPQCDGAYSPTKTWGAGGADEAPRACSPEQRMSEAPGGERRVVRRFPETNESEEKLNACGANEEKPDAADDLWTKAHAFSVFLPPGCSLPGEAWAEPCFPERAPATKTGGDERENEDNRVFVHAANGVLQWKDEREKRQAAEKDAKLHTGSLDKRRDAPQDDVDMDATTAAGLPFEDEGEQEQD